MVKGLNPHRPITVVNRIFKYLENKMTTSNYKVWIWLRRIGIIMGIFSASTFSLWGLAEAAVVYKFDKRYVQIISFEIVKREERVLNLQEKIFILQFKLENKTATILDKALLLRYKSELQLLTNGN